MKKIKVLYTNELTKTNLRSICVLKNSIWNHGIDSQIKFIKSNFKKKDLHILYSFGNTVVAYVQLRKRLFFYNKKKENFYLFDSLIVNKRFQNKKLSVELIKTCHKIFTLDKLGSILFCDKKLKNYYLKFGWDEISKKRVNFLKYKLKKNMIIMSKYFNEKYINSHKSKIFLNV